MELRTKFHHYCDKCNRYFAHTMCSLFDDPNFNSYDARDHSKRLGYTNTCVGFCGSERLRYSNNRLGMDDFEYFVYKTRDDRRLINRVKRFVSSVISIRW